MIDWCKFEIIWDKRNKTHVLKHFIELEEVERALYDPNKYLKRAGEQRYMVIGATFGRVLFIVVEDKGRNRVRPITAYDADKKMKRLYKSKR
ncbi:MAG: BrnT family toxin [archaeon]|nr:BrnT family toxin [archaeon]